MLYTYKFLVDNNDTEYFTTRVEVKGIKKLNKYLNVVRGLKKLWNIRMTVIPVVNCALRTVPKGLEERLEKLELRAH